MKKYFEELSDSRQAGKIKYNLVEVVVMAIIAVTAGAKHWNEIAMYCKAIAMQIINRTNKKQTSPHNQKQKFF